MDAFLRVSAIFSRQKRNPRVRLIRAWIATTFSLCRCVILFRFHRARFLNKLAPVWKRKEALVNVGERVIAVYCGHRLSIRRATCSKGRVVDSFAKFLSVGPNSHEYGSVVGPLDAEIALQPWKGDCRVYRMIKIFVDIPKQILWGSQRYFWRSLLWYFLFQFWINLLNNHRQMINRVLINK